MPVELNLLTELETLAYSFSAGRGDLFAAIGSCFAVEIGSRLHIYKSPCMINPLGIIFNPVSIAKTLAPVDKQSWSNQDLIVAKEGLYCHFDAHSTISAQDPKTLTETLKAKNRLWLEHLAKTRYLLVTWGTAWVYTDKATATVVASCHKQESSRFERRLLSIAEIEAAMESLLNRLAPDTKVILSVSPVRHTRDGLIESQASKSCLRYAAHLVSAGSERIYYFPAYEIMMDVLRDYRFYGEDLLHPSRQAADYIWKIFCNTVMSQESLEFFSRWTRILKDMAHRPGNPSGAAYQKHLMRTLEKLNRLKGVDVEEEIAAISKMIDRL